MYKAQGSLTSCQWRHSVDRSDGFTNSRDCTRQAPTGSRGIAREFTVVHSYDVPLDFTYTMSSYEYWSRAAEDIDRRGGTIGPRRRAYFARKCGLRLHGRLER